MKTTEIKAQKWRDFFEINLFVNLNVDRKSELTRLLKSIRERFNANRFMFVIPK